MEANDTIQDYQVWTYQKDKNIITKHKLISDNCSQATAIEGLTQLSTECLIRGVEHSIEEPECRCVSPAFYIRQHGEPTYIIYIEFHTGRRILYDLVYHKKEKDRVLEILTKTIDDLAEHGGPRAIPIVEERDDSVEREEQILQVRSAAIDTPDDSEGPSVEYIGPADLPELSPDDTDELDESDDTPNDAHGEIDDEALIILIRSFLQDARRDRE